MSNKNKLIIMGISVGIILLVLVANVIRKVKTIDVDKVPEPVAMEDIMTRAEAYRLLSYLQYDRSSRESMNQEITYADNNMSGWYDKYINAVWKMGLIDNYISVDPKKPLTYGDCKMMVDRYILANPTLQTVYSLISFDFMDSNGAMPIKDFVELYEAIYSILEVNGLREADLFVLVTENTNDGKQRIVTQLGRYFYNNSKDYKKIFDLRNQTVEEPMDETKEKKEKEEKAYITGVTEADFSNNYRYKVAKVLVRDNEIIYIKDIHMKRTVLQNIWIKSGKNTTVEMYINGVDVTISSKSRLSTDIEQVVGDIAIENQTVVGIAVKPDIIKGKVLETGKDYIEVEGYGKLPLEDNYRIYKIYGNLSMEETTSILVGYETADFVVSGGKISAALIRNPIKAENIRVLLNTTGYSSVYHSTVELTSSTNYIVKTLESEKTYQAGEVLTIKPGDKILAEGRVTIKPETEDGKIQINSIERSMGHPKYRGTIEVAQGESGLLIVNELPLEEYLYAVIPSEMPTYYGIESLKVQAVCARSYAYRHLIANSLSSLGAHVDDSVTYQVYNNIEENEDSILAVKDTHGKVVQYKDEVIVAYYFSTSCGHTTDVEYVWANGSPTPYLKGRLMVVEDGSKATAQTADLKRLFEDLTKEDNFRTFIMDQSFATYDSSYQWYRWNVDISIKDIKSNLDKKLKERYQINPNLILTLVSGSEKDNSAVYESIPVDTVGDIVDISILKRGTGGIICELLIKGTEKTIKVLTEYNIRALLSPYNSEVFRLDGSGVKGLSLLPSAFFVIDKNNTGDTLDRITIYGGGYGHGVGMSQNGVKALADTGKNYESIVEYFYQGTNLGYIYD